ncbi:MAG TPA: hypothetical protein VEG30_18050 [Terriglobales bacterium]|nr:hypothetical protein [Terriglobales bacterium]
MITEFKKIALMLAAGALTACLALAQDATTTTTTPPTTKPKPTIDQRKQWQQQRIGEGVENGSLTAGETQHLEKQEQNLNKEQQLMRSEDNGKLTAADRATLQKQQNHLSNEIYRDKHNARVQNYGNSEVGQRQRLQQQRIGQGIENGSLTAGEAKHLEGKEAAMNHEVHNFRQTNGGTMTPAERAKVNRQQNKVSNQIYNKKHNGNER